MAATATLALDEIRAAAADVLAAAGPGDPYVFADAVESLEPPALVLDWDDPWIMPGLGGAASMGPCLYTVRLRVLLVAARLEPAPGLQVIDELAMYVLGRMRADSYPWPLERATAPGQLDLAGVTYWAAGIVYAVPTSL